MSLCKILLALALSISLVSADFYQIPSETVAGLSDEDMLDDSQDSEDSPSAKLLLRRVTAQRAFLPGLGGFGYGGLGYGGLGYGGLSYGGLGYGGLGYGGLGYGGLYGLGGLRYGFFDEDQDQSDEDSQVMDGRNVIRIPGSAIKKLKLVMKKTDEDSNEMENQSAGMNPGIDTDNQGGDLTGVPQQTKISDRFALLRKYLNTDKTTKVMTVPHYLFRRLMRRLSKYQDKMNQEQTQVKVVKVPHEIFETLEQHPYRFMKKLSKYADKWNTEDSGVKVITVPHDIFESIQQQKPQRKIILVRSPYMMDTTEDDEM